MALEQPPTNCPRCGTRVAREAGDSTAPASRMPAEPAASDETISLPTLPADQEAGQGSAASEGDIEYRIGRYRLVRALGHGSYGAVWEAEDETLRRTVAVKLPRSSAIGSDRIEGFLKEARAVAGLNHPGIVRVIEVGETQRGVFIVSEFIEGSDMRTHLARHPPSVAEAVEFTRQLARALQHAHDNGIIHRDLKPANVMVDGRTQLHVMDFGLAKRLGGDEGETADGLVMGTPAYMSPEQARGDSRHVDPRSDVYSLGVMLFEMLTGSLPFRGRYAQLVQQVIDEDPPNPRALNAAVPVDLENICLKCLQKSPQQRYDSAAALESDLRAFAEGRPVSVQRVSTPRRLVKWCARNPVVAAFLTITALLTLTTMALFAAYIRREQGYRAAQQRTMQEMEQTLADKEAALAQAEIDRSAVAGAQQLLADRGRRALRRVYASEMGQIGELIEQGQLRRAQQLLEQWNAKDRATTRDWVWGYYADFLNRQIVFIDADSSGGSIKRVLWDANRHRCLILDADSALRSWALGQSSDASVPLESGVLDFDVAAGSGRLLVVDQKGNVRIGAADLSDPTILESGDHPFRSARWSPNGGQIAIASSDGSLQLRHAVASTITTRCPQAFPQLKELCWQPTGDRLAILGERGRLAIWDLKSDVRLVQQPAGFRSLAWGADGSRLLACSRRGLEAIDPQTGAVELIDSHVRHGRYLVCLPNSGSIAVVTSNLRVGQPGQLNKAEFFDCHESDPTALAASADGRFLITGGNRGQVAILDRDPQTDRGSPDSNLGSHGPKLLRHGGIVRRFAFNAAGTQVASAGWDGRVVTWDAQTFEPVGEFRVCEPGQLVEQVVWSSDDQRLAASCNNGALSFWDAKDYQLLGQCRGSRGLWGIAWHPQKPLVVAGGWDATVQIWNAQSFTKTQSWAVDGPVEQVAWNPDGNLIAVANSDVKVWNPTGKSRFSLPATVNGFRNVRFHPSQPWLAALAATGRVTVWDYKQGKTIAAMQKGTADPRGLAWLNEGKALAVASWDGRIRVWDVAAGELMLTLANPESNPGKARYWWVEFSPDETELWASDHSGAIQVWTLGENILQRLQN